MKTNSFLAIPIFVYASLYLCIHPSEKRIVALFSMLYSIIYDVWTQIFDKIRKELSDFIQYMVDFQKEYVVLKADRISNMDFYGNK